MRETGSKSREARKFSKEMEADAIICEKATHTFCVRRMRLNLLELEERYRRARSEDAGRKKRGKVGQCDMRNVNKVNNVT